MNLLNGLFGGGWWTVFVKEVRENFRDRRAMGMALLYGPLFGPVLFAVMTSFIVGKTLDDAEKPLKLPVAGVEAAPNLVEFLRQQGVLIKPAPADPEAAVRAQDEDVVLRIPAGFGDDWSAGKPSRIELLVDTSRRSSSTAVSRVRGLLERYSGQIGRLRLLVRGIDPQVMSPLAVAEHDLSTAEGRGATLLAMLPYFLILCAFLGGMYLAIDCTAGERERQSLEPLLINPVSATQIMAGKLAATTLFALMSVVSCVIAFRIGVRFIRTDDLGLALSISSHAAVLMVLLIAPVALLAASVQTIIASFARSFREAQTYLQFLMIIPAIPSVMLVVNPLKAVPWMLATPLLSQSLLINQLARGDALAFGDIALSVGGTLFASLIAALVAVRLYRGERLALAV
jgi:sodium transport system permease protein